MLSLRKVRIRSRQPTGTSPAKLVESRISVYSEWEL